MQSTRSAKKRCLEEPAEAERDSSKPPAKKNRVNEAAKLQHDGRGVGGADLTTQQAEKAHNYSITSRWEKRYEKWSSWISENVHVDHLDLSKVQLLAGVDLFLSIKERSPLGTEESSPLGTCLSAFEAMFRTLKEEIDKSNQAIASSVKEIEATKKDMESTVQQVEAAKEDIASLVQQMEVAKMDIHTTNEEIQNMREDIQALKSTPAVAGIPSGNQSLVEQLRAQLLAANTKTIEEKEKTIAANTNTIAANTKMIAANTNTIAAKTETIAANTNTIAAKTETIAAKTEMIAKDTKMIANNVIAFKKEAVGVKDFIKTISKAHAGMRNMLSYLSGKGNETVVTNRSQLYSVDRKRIDVTKIASPSEFDNFCPVTTNDFVKDLIGLVTEEKALILNLFQAFVILLFKSAKETSDQVPIDTTTTAILNWVPETKLNTRKKYGRPPTTKDCETKADQPVLHAIICRIIGIITTDDHRSVLHEHEHGVTTEQMIVVGSTKSNTKDRRIDVTAHQREEWLTVALSSMVIRPIEIKTAPRDRAKFEKAVEKGRSQVIGHLSKRLLHAFDFGGVGTDACAIGICLTQLSVEVIELKLSGAGTAEVALAATGTGCVPLLGAKSLPQDLMSEFESTETSGFVLLAGALIHTPALYHEFNAENAEKPSITQVFPTKEALSFNYLGSGAFANVVQVKEGQFMKIPKSASLEQSLIEEAAILKKLRRSPDSSAAIPQLVHDDVCTIQIAVRGEISEIAGLRLGGVVGQPLHSILREDWSKNADFIIRTVFEALKFAHSKKIYHMDVRPGNIIVGVQEGKVNAMLSDWGSSVDGDMGMTLTKFRGCTPYAHDHLLGKRNSFKLGAHLDFASLAYTIDHVETGKLQWLYEFNRPSQVTTADLKKRHAFVSKWLLKKAAPPQQLRSNDDIRAALMHACCFRRSERLR